MFLGIWRGTICVRCDIIYISLRPSSSIGIITETIFLLSPSLSLILSTSSYEYDQLSILLKYERFLEDEEKLMKQSTCPVYGFCLAYALSIIRLIILSNSSRALVHGQAEDGKLGSNSKQASDQRIERQLPMFLGVWRGTLCVGCDIIYVSLRPSSSIGIVNIMGSQHDSGWACAAAEGSHSLVGHFRFHSNIF